MNDRSRHTTGTILNELGAGPFTITPPLRHSQVAMTRQAVKITGPTARAATQMTSNALAPRKPERETTTETTNTRAARARRWRRLPQTPKRPGQRIRPGLSASEPPAGFEPATYALRDHQGS